MRRSPLALLTLATPATLSLAAFAALGAQAPAAPAKQPPIRPLGAVVARTTEPLGALVGTRALPGGRVLVHDPMQRRLVLYDSTLATATVVADSTAATSNAYGGRIGGMIPFRGDSTLFVDPTTLSMLVIDPTGKVARVASVPRAQDAFALVGLAAGQPAADAQGRIVYRASPFGGGRMMLGAGGPGAGSPPAMPDTVPLLRIDLATRKVDTVAYVKVQNTAPQVTREADGSIRVMMQVNPLPVVDDWVMTPSGTLALVRGRDYRVDWIAPDGARRSAPKLPFDWQRLSDEDKVALIDSVKAIRQRQAAAGGPGGGPGAVTMTFSGAPGGGAAPGGPARPPREGGERTIVMGGPGASGAPAMPGAPQVEFVSPSELPDYRPAFLPNATRADAEGNLWIRTTHTRGVPSGASVYDVVDPQGALIDRVQVPAGRTIVGFGAGGTVYLVAREGTAATATTTLERARVR